MLYEVITHTKLTGQLRVIYNLAGNNQTGRTLVRRKLVDLLDKIIAVHHRHLQIGKYKVVIFIADIIQRLAAVGKDT